MNGPLSRIFGGSSGSTKLQEAAGGGGSSLAREWKKVAPNYRNCEAPTSGKSWFAPIASLWERLMSQEYEKIAAASDLEASVEGKKNNSCGVLPSTMLQEVAEVSVACSSDAEKITSAHITSQQSSGRRCYGGGGGFPPR